MPVRWRLRLLALSSRPPAVTQRMAETLYLIEARARNEYRCSACQRRIQQGSYYFRHDPHPMARRARQKQTTHWCHDCIAASAPGPKDPVGRLWVPTVRVLNPVQASARQDELPLLNPLRVELIGIGPVLSERLRLEPTLIHQVTPDEFEEFVCDRLFAMGFEPRRVGAINRKDGGVDVLFWPRLRGAFPFLGAAQVRHHRSPSTVEGSPTVRDFAGTLAAHPFNAGLLVTNTSFSPDAEWFARAHARLVRLRDFTDIRRWLLGNFGDEAEWREIPSSIELCPGVVVRIR